MNSAPALRMSSSETDLLASALAQARVYLEYGSGGSTKLAARQPQLESITSVESDQAYIDLHVRPDPEVVRALGQQRLRFLSVDIGPTGDWGYPKNATKAHLWPNYALCPYLHGYRPDLILIDGRFRVACGLVAALQEPQARVLVHDYTSRRNYHVLERFFEIRQRADSLVELSRRPDFDERQARKLLRHYLYAPADETQATATTRTRGLLRKIKGRLAPQSR